MFGAFACGGGGSGGDGDGESFTVNGLWSVSGTSTSGTPNPDSDVCKGVAEIVGKLPPTALNVSSQDGTVTATEVGSDFAFTGNVDDSKPVIHPQFHDPDVSELGLVHGVRFRRRRLSERRW
jgi:hypothetical protein